VTAASERGMTVILDVHNYGRYRNQILGSPELSVAAFRDLWTKLATAFKGSTAIYGYDLMNEPHSMGGDERWPTAAQAAIDGIRSVDTETTIILEGDDWSGAWMWLGRNAKLLPTDPSNNLLYEAHQYFDRDGTGQYLNSADQENPPPTLAADRLKPFIDWLKQNGKKGFVGEYGAPANDPRWLAQITESAKVLASECMGAVYWAGGPWWGEYPLSIEPLPDGSDRPQLGAFLPQLDRYSACRAHGP
jgi:endoglucanase